MASSRRVLIGQPQYFNCNKPSSSTSPDTTVYEKIRHYQHPPLDLLPTSAKSTLPHPIPLAYLYPASHLIGPEGIRFGRDTDLADSCIRDLMAMLNLDAAFPESDPSLEGLGSASEAMLKGPLHLVNQILNGSSDFLSSDALLSLHGKPQWLSYSRTSVGKAFNGDQPAVFRTSTPQHRQSCGIVMSTDSLLAAKGQGGGSALDVLELYASKEHSITLDIFRRRQVAELDDATERLYEALRSMLTVCTTEAPFLCILSSYTDCLLLCVRPPTPTSPFTSVRVSCRYHHQRTGSMIRYKDQIRLDTQKVSIATVLLALSVRDSCKPLKPWNLPFTWPDELQVKEWAQNAVSEATRQQDEKVSRSPVLGKRKRVSSISNQRSSKRRAKNLTTAVQESTFWPPLLKTTISRALTDQLAESTSDFALRTYSLDDNLSFRILPIEKVPGRTDAYLALRPPEGARNLELELDCLLGSGGLGHTFLADFIVDDEPPAAVAVKVIVPDAYPPASLNSGHKTPKQLVATRESVREAVMDEVRLYLGPLAKTDIAPLFLGLWSGKTKAPQLPDEDATYDDIEVLLLITEYLPFEFNTKTATAEDWQDIASKYEKLGALGIEHGEADEDRWRGQAGDWRLINFEHARWSTQPPLDWEDSSESWASLVKAVCKAELEGVRESAQAWSGVAVSKPARRRSNSM